MAAVGGSALVGAPFDTIELAGSGTAYLFDGTTVAAAFRKRLPAGGFGSALASLGTDLVAGAPADGQEGGGRAYRLDGTTGSVRQTFTPPSPAPGSRFGTAAAVMGNAVAVGAPFAEVGGASYLFDGNTGQLNRTLSNGFCGCHHAGHVIAHVPHLFHRQSSLIMADRQDAVFIRRVRPGDHADYAFQLFSTKAVYLLDLRMGIRRMQDLAIQHAGQ